MAAKHRTTWVIDNKSYTGIFICQRGPAKVYHDPDHKNTAYILTPEGDMRYFYLSDKLMAGLPNIPPMVELDRIEKKNGLHYLYKTVPIKQIDSSDLVELIWVQHLKTTWDDTHEYSQAERAGVFLRLLHERNEDKHTSLSLFTQTLAKLYENITKYGAVCIFDFSEKTCGIGPASMNDDETQMVFYMHSVATGIAPKNREEERQNIDLYRRAYDWIESTFTPDQ